MNLRSFCKRGVLNIALFQRARSLSVYVALTVCIHTITTLPMARAAQLVAAAIEQRMHITNVASGAAYNALLHMLLACSDTYIMCATRLLRAAQVLTDCDAYCDAYWGVY
jgi:hypothetical protein